MQWQEGHVAPRYVSRTHHVVCRLSWLRLTGIDASKTSAGGDSPSPSYIYGVRTQVKRRGRGCRLHHCAQITAKSTHSRRQAEMHRPQQNCQKS